MPFSSEHSKFTICIDAKGHIVEVSPEAEKFLGQELMGRHLLSLNESPMLQKYLERLEEITTELMEARIKSEAANQTKEMFLTNINHEVRTPLNGVIGMATLLLNTPLNEKQELYVNRILLSAKILLDVFNQILDLSNLEFSLKPENFSPKETFHEVMAFLALKAQEKKIKFSFIYDENIPPSIFNDPIRLKQLILHIGGNAVKFTEAGEIKVKCFLKSPFIRIEIADTGLGIPQIQQSQLFEKFWQADMTLTRQKGGSGLGLAISKLIVDKMKGNIGFESIEKKGSIFWLEIPLYLRGS